MNLPSCITETCVYSPLGAGTTANYESVLSGKTALQESFSGIRNTHYFAARIKDADLDNWLQQSPPPSIPDITKFEKMCWIGLSDLLKSSGIDPANSRNLVIFSSTKGNITQLVDEKNRNENFQRFNLFSSAETITKRLGFFHPPQVISNACISGLIGILVANRWLHSGSFDNVFLIGADIVTDFVLQGFQSLLALSDHACTPFDKNRSGINLGEAVAGMVIRRNTNKGLCSIISGNVTNDAEHISSPSRTSSGLIDSIRKTLTGNDLPDFINAHGTGTRYNDEAEARAFLQTGLSNCPVLGLKGHFGHTLGAAGILETIFGIECMRKGELFPVAGFKEGDEAYPINVQKKRISLPLQHFLKSASGFGGCNATALFRNSA